MKTHTLSVTGTQSYTLRQGPCRHDITARVEGDDLIITMKRKPRLRWWRDLLVWHLWKRWRKTRIRVTR